MTCCEFPHPDSARKSNPSHREASISPTQLLEPQRSRRVALPREGETGKRRGRRRLLDHPRDEAVSCEPRDVHAPWNEPRRASFWLELVVPRSEWSRARV